MAALAQLTDLVSSTAARVLQQYQKKPRFMALHRGLTQLVQDAETAVFGIVAQLDVDAATGVWLDFLGNFVGEPRAGANDTDYRKFIKARIIANRSQGAVEDIISVIKTVTGLSTFAVTRLSPASLEVILDGYAMAEPIRTRLMQLLRAARAAGVRLMVLYASNATDTNMFLFSSNDTMQASTTQGTTTTDDDDDTDGGKLADADAP
jgi:hypothetical protein